MSDDVMGEYNYDRQIRSREVCGVEREMFTRIKSGLAYAEGHQPYIFLANFNYALGNLCQGMLG